MLPPEIKKPIYFDHNATSPLLPSVRETMLPWLGWTGNPSSTHTVGRIAREAIEIAREQVAVAVGASASEVIFTSSGTEAANFFIKSAAARNYQEKRVPHCWVGAIEHAAVLEPARQIAEAGGKINDLPVDSAGLFVPAALDVLLEKGEKPTLAALMLAHNETGAIQDILPLLNRLRASQTLICCDAVQAFGKIPLNFSDLKNAGVHAIFISAHKIGGPLGAGALICDKRTALSPLIAGGGQENGLRSGTENLPAIVGFGAAASKLYSDFDQKQAHLRHLQSTLENGLRTLGACIFSENAPRLPNTSYFALSGFHGETLVGLLDNAGFAVASGAACKSQDRNHVRYSPVLAAMGVPDDLAACALRISFSGSNTVSEVFAFLDALKTTMQRLQRLSSIAVL